LALNGDFVQGVLSEMDDFARKNLRISRFRKDLSFLTRRVCGFHKVTVEELRSGSRRHVVVKARGELSRVAVQLFGYSGAKVARYLGVTSSCVTGAVSSGGRLQELKDRYGEIGGLCAAHVLHERPNVPLGTSQLASYQRESRVRKVDKNGIMSLELKNF